MQGLNIPVMSLHEPSVCLITPTMVSSKPHKTQWQHGATNRCRGGLCRRASRRQCGSRAPYRKGSAAFLLIRALCRWAEGSKKKGRIKDDGEKEERPKDAASDVFCCTKRRGTEAMEAEVDKQRWSLKSKLEFCRPLLHFTGESINHHSSIV